MPTLTTMSTLNLVLRNAMIKHRRERDAFLKMARDYQDTEHKRHSVAYARDNNKRMIQCLKAYRELFPTYPKPSVRVGPR